MHQFSQMHMDLNKCFVTEKFNLLQVYYFFHTVLKLSYETRQLYSYCVLYMTTEHIIVSRWRMCHQVVLESMEINITDIKWVACICFYVHNFTNFQNDALV